MGNQPKQPKDTPKGKSDIAKGRAMQRLGKVVKNDKPYPDKGGSGKK